MRRNPFLRFHRAAESAGYPALLIVAVIALAVVLGPFLLLAMVGGASAFALTIVCLAAAIALVAGATLAALSEDDDPPTGRPLDPPASSA